MKNKLSKSIFVSLVFSLSALGLPRLTYAANLWFSPASGSYSQGSIIKVGVGINTSGVNINAVQANFTYPADKLQFSSISTGGSVLSIVAEKSGGGGVVRIAGGLPSPGFSGSKLLATVYFKVLANSGSATLSTSGDSSALKDVDNQNALSGGASSTFTLTALSAQPTSAPSQSGSSSLSITEVSTSNITSESLYITWKTNKEASSTVEYGQNDKYGMTLTSPTLVTDHAVQITGLLVAGNTYHFRVISKDKNGTEVTSSDNTFQVSGYKVTVRVRDSGDNPILGALVSWYSPSIDKETGVDGTVIFDNVSVGKHGLVVKHGGFSKILEVNVVNNIDPHEVLVTFSNPSFIDTIRTSKYLPIGIAVLAGLLVLTLLSFILVKLFKKVNSNQKVNIVNPTPLEPQNIPVPPSQPGIPSN